MSSVKHFRELDVYQGAMSLVMRIFELTKRFPIDERYTLTDQVRRSSRSVCANLAEAWRKRRYQAAFVSKLNDAETEAAETQVHAEIAFRHGYLNRQVFNELDDACDKSSPRSLK
jgi:four helix bundle protein